METPILWVLAGPNGAGKTTYARRHYPELISDGRFLNADDRAGSLTPSNPSSSALGAGRWLIARRTKLIMERSSFAIETTLATHTLLRAIKQAKQNGFVVWLIYLFISNPALCIQRVAHRVTLGGHHIPTDVIFRRYELSLQLLPTYLEESDMAEVFSADASPDLVLRKSGSGLEIRDQTIWDAISVMSRKGRFIP